MNDPMIQHRLEMLEGRADQVDRQVARLKERRKILIQLDSDRVASVFDRVVAVDAGADEVFSYGGITPEDVRGIVHGAIFTRGPRDLARTALFIGGSDVEAGERLLAEAQRHMLPQIGLRVSVLLDANGANTTAAAAVRAAGRHLDLATTRALVLGGTGPVGRRAVLLLASLGAQVAVGSRQRDRAGVVVRQVQERFPNASLESVGTGTEAELKAAVQGRSLIIAAGAAGVVLLPRPVREGAGDLRLAIDLNAVPPLGIEGVDVTDRGAQREGFLAYGALGVGETKMKIHKAAVAALFESNDRVLDALEIYSLAQGL